MCVCVCSFFGGIPTPAKRGEGVCVCVCAFFCVVLWDSDPPPPSAQRKKMGRRAHQLRATALSDHRALGLQLRHQLQRRQPRKGRLVLQAWESGRCGGGEKPGRRRGKEGAPPKNKTVFSLKHN